jgi:hypothetical protein
MSKIITNSPGFVSKLLENTKMPAFTLYGSRGSTNTDRVRLTLAEGGFTNYDLVFINLQKGEQKVSESYFFEEDVAFSHMRKYNADTVATSLMNT